MNDIQKLEQELKAAYPNRTIVLDAPHHLETGYWWLDIDRVSIIWTHLSNRFEVSACPVGCVSENHAFEYGGDVMHETKEATMIFVRHLLDNNGYTHKL